MTWFRQHLVLGSILTLLILGVPGYFGWRCVAIAYHRQQMKSAYAQINRAPEAGNRYEQHRAALIRLGYFVKQQFYLKRITAQSPDFQLLLANLQLQFPNQIGKVEGHGYIYGEPTFLVVWMHATDAKQIGDYIQPAGCKIDLSAYPIGSPLFLLPRPHWGRGLG